MTAKEFAENHQYDLEEHDEGGYLGINEETFAKLLDEYAEAKAKESTMGFQKWLWENKWEPIYDGFTFMDSKTGLPKTALDLYEDYKTKS